MFEGISNVVPLEGDSRTGLIVVVESALFVIGSSTPEALPRQSSTCDAVVTCIGSFVTCDNGAFARVRFLRVAAA
jgi:hypothetical protein